MNVSTLNAYCNKYFKVKICLKNLEKDLFAELYKMCDCYNLMEVNFYCTFHLYYSYIEQCDITLSCVKREKRPEVCQV